MLSTPTLSAWHLVKQHFGFCHLGGKESYKRKISRLLSAASTTANPDWLYTSRYLEEHRQLCDQAVTGFITLTEIWWRCWHIVHQTAFDLYQALQAWADSASSYVQQLKTATHHEDDLHAVKDDLMSTSSCSGLTVAADPHPATSANAAVKSLCHNRS